MLFFLRAWTPPAAIARDDLASLTAIVSVEIGPELQVGELRIIRSSGHELFDRSVADAIGRLRAEDARIPPPPEAVADQYVGRTITIRFRGRDAR